MQERSNLQFQVLEAESRRPYRTSGLRAVRTGAFNLQGRPGGQRKLKVNGKEVRINKPLDAMMQGMAYLPEDGRWTELSRIFPYANSIIALQAKRYV